VEAANLYLAAHNLENGTNYRVDLNQNWQMRFQGMRVLGIQVSDKLSMTESLGIRVNQANIASRAQLVKPGFDSETLDRQTPLVEKCRKDTVLKSALTYFSEEVIDNDRPLYGVYKAIEALSKKCGGRAALGKLVGKGKTFVDEVMQTAQLTRHHEDPHAERMVTDQECKERAKLLITAYAGARLAPPPAPSANGVSTKALDVPWAFGEKQIFCSACQAMTTQNSVMDQNNEILITCHCGRHLKFPLTETEEQLDALLAAHGRSNQGQVRA